MLVAFKPEHLMHPLPKCLKGGINFSSFKKKSSLLVPEKKNTQNDFEILSLIV